VRRQLSFEIFSASLAAILIEVAYTRVFSFKVYYYFTYLIIGIALMGLGAGAVLVTLVRRLNQAEPDRVVAGAGVGGGATILAGYYVVATTQLNASALSFEVGEVLKLLGVATVVTLPFLAIGVIVATILSRAGDHVGRLYAADLVGAGLGCAVAIPLLRLLDPPRVIVLAGAVLALSGVRAAAVGLKAAAVIVAIVNLAPLGSGAWLPDPVVDRLKGFEDFRNQGLVRTSRWDPVFRVDVAEHPTDKGDLYLLFHDGSPGSGMRRMDAGQTAFGHLETSSRRLPFEVLENKAPRVLIIGSAGGHEVVASLHFGASHVTGVELNQTTLDLLKGEYADITGHLADDPRVTLINGDGRWFLSETDETFDLIWFVAPDSYAAMNASTSGAYVLAESFLYTVETLDAAIARLSPRGVICAQFGEFDFEKKPNRTVRFIATGRQAFYDSKIPDLDERVLVSTAQGLPPFMESTVILSQGALTTEQMNAFQLQVERRIPEGKLRYLPRDRHTATPVGSVVNIPQDLIADWYREYPYEVGPVRDESPFFWHFARFRDALAAGGPAEGHPIDFEDAIGERVIFVLLGVAALLGVLFLLLPLTLARASFRGLTQLGPTAVYFASLGVGFMFIEVTLIQKLTLLLGYPTRSLSVTLMSLLVSSGAGSYFISQRKEDWPRLLGHLLAALVILVTVWLWTAPTLVETFVGAPLFARVFVSMLLTVPIGLCLGGFLPVGMRAITQNAPHPETLTAWAWAVNAFASVVASILAAVIAMAVAFKFLVIAAPVIYAAGAIALLRLVPARGAGTQEG
jgi:spermidine synthase